MMRRGAEMIIKKETNWRGEMVSPRKSQPRMRYRTGAS